MGQWSMLPDDLLLLIEDHLSFYVDKVRIRVVCLFWNYCLPNMPNHKHRQFPLILHALENNKDASHALFNPIEKKSYLLDLPELKGMLFKGSSYGWVVTLGGKDEFLSPEISLFNPLTRVRIKLPSRSKFTDVVTYSAEEVGSEYCLFDLAEEVVEGEVFSSMNSSDEVNFELTRKFILSSPPGCDDCFIVAIYGPQCRMAYCKLNDETWTPLLDNFKIPDFSCFVDIIFYQGKLHVIDLFGRLFAFEDKEIGPYTNLTKIVRDHLPNLSGEAMVNYLVASSSMGLIMLVRFIKDWVNTGRDGITHTYCFKAYKLNSIRSSWVEVNDIGEDVLFVGLNSSFSVSSHDYPEYERNHVYFTDSNNTIGDSDTGVFNLENGTLRPLSGFKDNPKFAWPVPLWINIG